MINPEIFQAGEITYHLAHVLSSAEVRGKLEPIREYLGDSLACQLYAEDQGFELDEDEVQAASETFRYEKHLLTAEETAQWLEQWRLTEDDLSEYLVRVHWRRRFDAELLAIREDYRPSEEQVHGALWQEIVLGGRLKELALTLARRVAAMLEAGEADPPVDIRAEVSRTLTGQRHHVGHDLDIWMEQIPSSSEWLEAVVAMEAHHLAACRKTLTLERCVLETQTRRLSLLRMVVESALFPSATVAHEAFLCVTQDGESLESVADRAGGRVAISAFLLGNLPEPLQQRFLSAAPGEVIEPLEGKQGFSIHRVREKIEPDLSDPETRRNVEDRLLSAFFDAIVGNRIRWLLSLE